MKDVISSYRDKESTMKQVAFDMGIPYSTLMRKLNPDDNYQLNINQIVPLILATGRYDLIHHLNKDLNLVAFPLNIDESDFNIKGIAAFTKETGEAFVELSKAMADKVMTKNEAIKCRKELMDVGIHSFKLVKELDTIIYGRD